MTEKKRTGQYTTGQKSLREFRMEQERGKLRSTTYLRKSLINYNYSNTIEALQENIAIAAAKLENEKGQWIFSPLTISMVYQIAIMLWNIGYRLPNDQQEKRD